MGSLDRIGRWLHGHDPARRNAVAVATRMGDGWADMTYGGLDRASAATARWLAGAGVEPGDRVVLLCEAGGPWTSAFLGILRRGAMAVPLDPRLTVEEMAVLHRRSSPAAALVSGPLLPRWQEAAGPPGAPVLVLDAEADGLAKDDVSPGEVQPDDFQPDRWDVDRRSSEAAVLVWTSGTTGEAKGVMLSLRNLSYVVDEARAVQGVGPDDRWLSVLPPNHLLELCCGLLPALAVGSTTFVARTLLPGELISLARSCRATRMVVVPLVLRSLRRHLEAEERRCQPEGQAPGGGQAETGGEARLGGLRALYCGGAPLDAATEGYFRALGVGVLPGYGLTEAGPTVAMNSPGADRPGSVGRPLADTDLALGADGEILVRGPGVMLGYRDDPAATREAVDAEGWLHTGDLGRLDPDGYLFVTGRSKSLIVLDSGKKVQPEEVEAALGAAACFDQVCVVGWNGGDGRGEQVCAVVVPAGSEASLGDEAAAEEVRRLTSGLSGYKRPTVVRVVAGPLPATPKASVRRAEVVRLLDAQLAAGLTPAGGTRP